MWYIGILEPVPNYLSGDIHNLDVSLKINKAQPYQNEGSKPGAINIIVRILINISLFDAFLAGSI